MNDSLHIAETDLALYAMGTLSEAEMESARAHLEVCARCKEELRQNNLALAAYAQTTLSADPPNGAKERFLARLAANPQHQPIAPAQARKPASSWREFITRPRAPWAGAFAGALAILLFGVGLDDIHHRAQMRPLLSQAQRGAIDSAQLAQLMELLTSPQAQRVALHTAPVASPPPEGRVVYEARTGKLLMTASNLHPLPAGKTYELWILQPAGKKPLPAGTFAPDSAGNAAIILAQAPAGLTVQGFGVTIENAGGSETPTLPIVLSGL